MINNLLPIIDNFERSLENEEVSEGVKLIYKQFIDFLNQYNVTVINPSIGDIFDDSVHNAIAAIPGDENNNNTISYVSLKGYKLEDKIIRYAQVGVYVN